MNNVRSDIYSKQLATLSRGLFTLPGESLFEAANRLKLFDFGEIKLRNKTLLINEKQNNIQEIKVTGPIEIISEDIKRVCRVLGDLKYRIFREDYKDFNLNIVGIRNDSSEPCNFDDEIWVFWRFNNKWTLKKYKATTDPGLAFLLDPITSTGTAILKEGQYLGAYRMGKHRGLYDALVQSGPVTVIRDFNRDKKLDFSSGKAQTGLFGINIHRASPTGESINVGKWSAGCQVFARIKEYNDFISLCKKAIGEWGNEFSYTLINKRYLA